MAFLGKGRNRNERNTGAVAEEVNRLDIAGIVVAAAFIEGDEDRRRRPELRIALYPIDQALDKFFIVVGVRIPRVSGKEFKWTNV